MRKKIFIFFIIYHILLCFLFSTVFKVKILSSENDEFISNVTLQFTDLNDREFKRIFLGRKIGIVSDAELADKFNLNLILKNENIEFIDGITQMPYVLWGGIYEKNNVINSKNFIFKVEPISFRFSRVIDIYRKFCSILNEYKENSHILPFKTNELKYNITIEYPPHFENDNRKPFIYIKNNDCNFYLFPGEDFENQIYDFFSYLYALNFFPDNFDGNIIKTLPENRKKIFPTEIGSIGVTDDNIMLENMRIFSKFILFSKESKNLTNLSLLNDSFEENKAKLDKLKAKWDLIKKSPDKKSEKFKILKELLEIKKKIRKISSLESSPENIIGNGARYLIDLYKNKNISFLKILLSKIKSGSIKKSQELFLELQKNKIFAKKINKKRNRKKNIRKKITNEYLIDKLKKTSKKPDNIISLKEFKKMIKSKSKEENFVDKLSKNIDLLVKNSIPKRINESENLSNKVRQLYDDFYAGRLILDTFLRRKIFLTRELFSKLRENMKWALEESISLKRISKDYMLSSLKDFSNKMSIMYKNESAYYKSEDEKIFFIGKNTYNSFNEDLKKLLKVVSELEVKFAKLLFINDKFKLYSKENLSALQQRISVDATLIKNQLLSISHVKLSTKIVIYQTIKKLLKDYLKYIIDYHDIEYKLNKLFSRFKANLLKNRYYLSKKLYIIINEKKKSISRKLNDVTSKYEKFSKAIVTKEQFSKENINKLLFQINRFLEISVPINEDKIFRQLSKNGTGALDVKTKVEYKTNPKELALIAKIKNQLDSHSKDIEAISKKVEEKNNKLKIIKFPVSEDNSKILRKKLLKKEAELLSLKKHLAINKNNLNLHNFEETIDYNNKKTNLVSSNSDKKSMKLNHKDIFKKNNKKSSSAKIVQKRYYFSDIKINEKPINRSFYEKYFMNDVMNGITITGKIEVEGIRIKNIFIYDDKENKYFAQFDGNLFIYKFYPQLPGVYHFRIGFSDNYEIEYLLNKRLKITIVPDDIVRPVKIKKRIIRKEKSNLSVKESNNNFYEYLSSVFKNRDLKRFKKLTQDSNSLEVYNLISDLNRLFSENDYIDINISSLDKKVLGTKTKLKFMWTIETDESEYSGISEFLIKKENGKISIIGFNGNKFYE